MNPNQGNTGMPPSPSNDTDFNGRRVRLRPKPKAMSQIIGTSKLLAPLQAGNGGTNGMLWPYQPVINYQQDVEYQAVPMVHTNQEFYAYTRTNAVKFSCEGEFTVQNQTEGRYALACIHFLRTVTKMYFGTGDNLGTPPPILLFDAFGKYMFDKLPVIVTSFNVTMPKDVDYVPVDLSALGNISLASLSPTKPNSNSVNRSGTNSSDTRSANGEGFAWLPALFSITVSMTVQNTPAKMRTFNLNEFRSGSLLKGGGWI